MRIASRLEMPQCLDRCASMRLPAVRVARWLQPGYRVAWPQHPLVCHPPIIQPLPLFRAVIQASGPLIGCRCPWSPLTGSISSACLTWCTLWRATPPATRLPGPRLRGLYDTTLPYPTPRVQAALRSAWRPALRWAAAARWGRVKRCAQEVAAGGDAGGGHRRPGSTKRAFSTPWVIRTPDPRIRSRITGDISTNLRQSTPKLSGTSEEAVLYLTVVFWVKLVLVWAHSGHSRCVPPIFYSNCVAGLRDD